MLEPLPHGSSAVSPPRPTDGGWPEGALASGLGAVGESVAALERKLLGEMREIAGEMREIEGRLLTAAEAREAALAARCVRWAGVTAPLAFAAGLLLGIGVAGRRW